MYLIQTSIKFGKVTGNIYDIDFVNGIALVDKQYDYRRLIELGFRDVTPFWMKDIDVDLSGFDKQVLFIRFGGVGDDLIITPILKAFKKKYPNVKVFFQSRFPQGEVLLYNSDIDEFSTPMKHNTGHFIGQYDQVYDLTHSIEWNSESEYRDVKEITSEIVNIPIKDYRPKINLLKEEIEVAKGILLKNNINFKINKIIGIQVEASSGIRTLPIRFSKILANRLVKENTKVIFLGKEAKSIMGYNFIKCGKCKKEKLIFMDTKKDIEIKCGKCKNIIRYSRNKNIVSLVGKLKIREYLSIARLCDLIISPDTGMIHIAQAFNIPCIGLYSSFDYRTRVNYYDNLEVVQLSYPCAPCFQHGVNCHRTDEYGVSKCMSQFAQNKNINKVYKIAKKFLDKKMIFGKVISFARLPKGNMKCLICDSRKSKVFARKGDNYYLRCPNCYNLYLDKIDSLEYQEKKYFDGIYKKEAYKRGQKVLADYLYKVTESNFQSSHRLFAFEIGSGLGYILKHLKQKYKMRVVGLEKNEYAGNKTKKIFPTFIGDWEKFENKPKEKYHLIITQHSIEHFKNIVKSMLKINDFLIPGGLLYIGAPNGEKIFGNKSIHLNTYYAGKEHINLFGKKALEILAMKTGFKISDYQNIGSSFRAWLVKK